MVQSDSVRSALALVARGEAAFGITYASDALAAPELSVLAHFPAESHPPILYPAALLTESGEAGRGFYEALADEEASAIFAAAGFTVLH